MDTHTHQQSWWKLLGVVWEVCHTQVKKKKKTQDTGPVLPFWLLMKMKGQSQCLDTEALAIAFHA